MLARTGMKITALAVTALAVTGLGTDGRSEDASADFACRSVGVLVDHGDTWHTYEFHHPESGLPITAKLFGEVVQGKDTVFVYQMGRWVELHHRQERVGSRLRIEHGSMARIIFSYEDCHEIIEPKDKITG